MIIYSYKRECYHCHNIVKTYTYIYYQKFYGDVTFPYDEWCMNEVYAVLHSEEPYFDKEDMLLNFPIFTLGNNDELDQIVLKSGVVNNIKYVKSGQWPTPYLANVCPKCGRFLGKYHLLEYITDNNLKSNTDSGLSIEHDI